MQWRSAFVAGVFVCSMAASCARQDSVRACNIAVNSVADPYADTAAAYFVLPLDESVAESDPRFIEYSRYLQRALDARGYRLVRSLREAQVVVFFGYGMGPTDKRTNSKSPPALQKEGFTRYAIVNAVDAAEYRNEHRLVRVWSTKIVSIGDTADLRAMLPALLAGAWDLFGVDAGSVVHRRVDLNGADVFRIKDPANLSALSTGEPLPTAKDLTSN